MTPLNPTTSLSMIYLRAYARDNATRRGMVRASRKAMHLLRMHWSACATGVVNGPEIAADGLSHQNSDGLVFDRSDRLQGESGRIPTPAQGCTPAWDAP